MQNLVVQKDDDFAKKLLRDNQLKRAENFYTAVVEKVSNEKIHFRLIESEKKSPGLKEWVQSLRLVSITATLVPTLCVFSYQHIVGAPINALYAVLFTLAAVFLQFSVNLLNDYYDYVKLIDTPQSLGGSGVILSGKIPSRSIMRAGFLFSFLAIFAGIPLFMENPIYIGGLGIIGLIGAIEYSSEFIGFKYRALGDLVVFFLCGPVLCLAASISATGSWSVFDLYVGTYFGLLAAAILHANNFQDIDVDTSSGSKTVASLIGFEKSKKLFFLYYFVAWVSLGLLAFNINQILALSPAIIVSVLLSFKLILKVLKAKSAEDDPLKMLRVEAAQTHMLLGIILTINFLFIWV